MMPVQWSTNYLSQRVLDEILPSEGRDAIKQGALFVHSLHHYFGPDLALPDYRGSDFQSPSEFMLELVHGIKRDAHIAAALCMPHFDTDLGFFSARFWPDELGLRRMLVKLFNYLTITPRYELTLNLGDDTCPDARSLTRAVLDIVNSGHTRLEPQIVFRVRRGVNFNPEDPNYDLLMAALEVARSRKGIAFSLMDSALNSQWINLAAYTTQGLRVEPEQCDLYAGCRGQVVPGRVSLNVPLLESYGRERLLNTLGIAARLLAHRFEVVQPASIERSLPLIINLSGLPSHNGVFELLETITKRVARLRQEYNCNFLLAATAEEIPFVFSPPKLSCGAISPVLAASLQHMLPGGHCYLVAAGLHRSSEELYQQLSHAVNAGVSFMRFEVDDTRCALCALPVAALGPCPACGNESRRTVTYNESRLEECMRNADNPKGQTTLWLSS